MNFLLLFVGLLILTAGAEVLIRGATGIAFRLGLSELLVGLTVVSFGTSAPELAVSVQSALGGQPGIALGNVIGSNIFNVALILGTTAAISPLWVDRKVIRREMPILLFVTMIFAGWIIWQGSISRPVGIVFVAGLIYYTIDTFRQGRREAKKSKSPTNRSMNVAVGLALVLAGLFMLVFGSRLFVTNAVEIARSLGISEAVIGLTIVAAGTSLPELAASVVAALRGKAEMAIGNIVGSNLFNILCIAGITSIVHPIPAGGISLLDLGTMVFTAVLLLPFMKSGFRLSRKEGLVLVGIQLVYLWLVWPKT